jgi:hypothetical protein
MPDRKLFTVVEIDLPFCANTYGSAPCTAAVGVTGADKCYNTIRTCQDRINLVATTRTLRLCEKTEDVPYDAIPCLYQVAITPGVIDPGRSIGTRGKVTISAADFPTSDTTLDPYVTGRSYDPFSQGTFWPKLRARHVSLQGAALRVMRGELGEDLSTFRVEHYFVESMLIDGQGADIVAKDALSFCDPKKAQCPVLSGGRLAADIGAAASSWTLVPSGIGDLEYPASGIACLSGKEILSYTRSGDVITITGLDLANRGLYGTTRQEHEADSIFQQVAVFDGQSAAEIVYSLLVDYTPGIDAAWCDLDAWSAEADLYIGHLYHAVIPAPTSVKALLDEMMIQAGCSLWWDPVAERVMFQTLRPIAASATVIDGSSIVGGSFKAKEQPDKRVSQHWTYYGLSNATNKVDKESNFKAAVAKIDPDAEDDYGAPAFDKVLARWIAVDNRPAAERLNAMKVARYRDPPRAGTLQLFPTSPFLPGMGEGIQLRHFTLQAADGSDATVPFYVTSVNPGVDGYSYQVEEFLFAEDAVPDDERAVFIDVDHFNVNLRALYDTLYSSVPTGATITFAVAPGAYVGGQVLGSGSIIVEAADWPLDTVIRLVIGTPTDADAKVLGRGGDGAGYPGPTTNGQAGSPALYFRRAVTLVNYGTIGGGGGGGEGRAEFGESGGFSAAGGGGGAGFNGYDPAAPTVRIGGRRGNGGTIEAENGGTENVGGGGAPGVSDVGPGGEGGDLGGTGHYKTGATGHSAAGVAIDGVSYVTFENTGTILGAQIN